MQSFGKIHSAQLMEIGRGCIRPGSCESHGSMMPAREWCLNTLLHTSSDSASRQKSGPISPPSLFRDFKEGESSLTTTNFIPAADIYADIYEDEKKIVLKLESPGIPEKDLDVSAENNTLTVKGERKFEKEGNFHRLERRYGRFFRAFTLPATIETENIDAKYENGVLKLELKKKPEAQPKQIKVKVNKSLTA